MTISTSWTYLRINFCDSTVSVITSGNGPSSRIEPANTNGTSFLMHSYIIPLFNVPSSTASLIEPERLILFIALIWWVWPWATTSPVFTFTPREVPNWSHSISWVAKAFPAKITSMNPSLISWATMPAEPVWTIAGPPTSAILPPLDLISLISDATSLIMLIIGFSDETSLFINSNTPCLPLDLCGGVIFTPSRPTTIKSPFLISAIGLQDAVFASSSITIKQSISISFTRIHSSL